MERIKMKVAILSPFHNSALKQFIPDLPVDNPAFPKGSGGYCITNLVTERLSKGLYTDIITLDTTTQKPIQLWEGKYVRLWVVQRREKKTLRNFFNKEINLIHQVLDNIKPDICHAHWTYEYGLAAIKQNKYPVVLTVHDQTFKILRYYGLTYLPLFFITLYVIIKSQNISAVSPYIARYLNRVFKKKSYVIPNLLPDFIWNIKNDKDDGAIRIFSSLNMTKLKNLKNALLAFQIARDHFLREDVNLSFTITGIALREIPDSWKDSPSIMHDVHFMGKLPYIDNIYLMSRSDIVLHPSLEESFGGPIAEGMALNKPVIAAIESEGSSWLLDYGKCGILTVGKSINKIAQDIIILINKILRKEYDTKVAYERIKEISNANNIINEYEELYEIAKKNFKIRS